MFDTFALLKNNKPLFLIGPYKNVSDGKCKWKIRCYRAFPQGVLVPVMEGSLFRRTLPPDWFFGTDAVPVLTAQ